MMRTLPLSLLLLAVAVVAGGCAKVPAFPSATVQQNGRWMLFDVDGDGRLDYRQQLDEHGRKIAIGYDLDHDGNFEQQLSLERLRAGDVPHYVIILDGVPFEIVQRMYRQGHFRLFYPPARLISCFPSMTDLAFARVFGTPTPIAYEAKYLDRETHKLSDADKIYLSGENARWEQRINYRCPKFWDGLAYLWPGWIFKQEISHIKHVFDVKRRDTVLGYTVASAAWGTHASEAGFEKLLKMVDATCEQLTYERRGAVNISIFADHGHNLTPGERVDVEKLLSTAGFHPSEHISKPNDVVVIEFGLVTYVSLYTRQPAKVAEALLADERFNLAFWPADRCVMVASRDGLARVESRSGRYRYSSIKGDPLQLKPILEHLAEQGAVDADGFVDDVAFFKATATHIYPDPLRRIWMAFHGLVQQPPDLLVTTRDGYFCGSKDFARIVKVASTHGSLNRRNSTTFVLTTVGPLPKTLRLEQVLPAIGIHVPTKSSASVTN